MNNTIYTLTAVGSILQPATVQSPVPTTIHDVLLPHQPGPAGCALHGERDVGHPDRHVYAMRMGTFRGGQTRRRAATRQYYPARLGGRALRLGDTGHIVRGLPEHYRVRLLHRSWRVDRNLQPDI